MGNTGNMANTVMERNTAMATVMGMGKTLNKINKQHIPLLPYSTSLGKE